MKCLRNAIFDPLLRSKIKGVLIVTLREFFAGLPFFHLHSDHWNFRKTRTLSSRDMCGILSRVAFVSSLSALPSRSESYHNTGDHLP